MGNMNIVTGQTGVAHITSSDQASFNMGVLGNGECVLNIGEKFGASIVSNNSVKILDGDVYMQGRHIRINTGLYLELVVENGDQSVNRNDLIVVRYEKDEDTAVESASLVVVKGTSGITAEDPDITVGDIRDGAILHEMPLYRLCIEGLTLTAIEQLFDTRDSIQQQLDDTIELSNKKIDALFE